MDVTPLRTSRDFRLLFLAGTVFYFGGMVSYVAVPFQIYDLTGSNLAVGAIGLVELVPLVVFGLYGGALADHVDRRRLLIGTGVGQAVLTAVLAVNAFRDEPSIPVIFAVAGLLTATGALQRPSREALMPRTVHHDEIPAAQALTSFGMQLGVLVGPAIGGLLVAYVGIGWCFVVDVAGLAVATALYVAMRGYAHQVETTPPSLRAIGEGWSYAVRRKDLLGTYVVDMVAMFMAMPIVLFPALAQHVFEQPKTLGLLYTAESVGTLIATLTSGWTSRFHHHGRAVVVASMVWGGSIGLAGLAPNVWVCLLFLVVAGGGDMVSGIFRSIIWHQTIPDEKRGRLAGIEMLSYSVGPLGGQARAGLVADATSVRASIVSGGVLCVLGVAATSAWLRDFWRYDAQTDEHAVHERQVRSAREARETSTAAEVDADL
jgi:MFS family permease